MVFYIKKPVSHFNLLDRFLVMMESYISLLWLPDKQDVWLHLKRCRDREIYEPSGYRVVHLSAQLDEENTTIRELSKRHNDFAAGPSRCVSSLINCLQQEIQMETGQSARRLTAASTLQDIPSDCR